MVFTDLISRIPSGKTLPPTHYDKEFVVANIKKKLTKHSILRIFKNCHALRLVHFWKFPITQDCVITYQHRF